jgi:fatty-acyl-CoA synthase
VDAFSQGLLDLGFEKGDRLGIWLPNTAEWVVAEFATAKTGIILVNVNPAYRVYELECVPSPVILSCIAGSDLRYADRMKYAPQQTLAQPRGV